ncbi:MAG: hypothetical protein WD960_15945 [Gemmatimonadota bacterium]
MNAEQSENPARQGFRSRSVGARRSVVAVIVCVGIFIAVPEAMAQTSVRFLPSIGVHMPPSDARDAGSPSALIASSRAGGALAWGLGVEIGPPRSGTSLRGHVGHGTTSRMPLPGFECADCSSRSSVRTISAAAVFRPIPRVVLVQPHFVTGLGVSNFEHQLEGSDVGDRDGGAEGAWRLSGQLGVGLEVSLLGLRTQWEVNAFVSPRRPGPPGEEGLATDLYVTLAIPIGG